MVVHLIPVFQTHRVEQIICQLPSFPLIQGNRYRQLLQINKKFIVLRTLYGLKVTFASDG